MKPLLKQIFFVITLMFASSALALDPVYTTLFSNDAIKGYDSVAYFTEGEPVKGQAEFSIEYQGANWLFSSQENLKLFSANPEKYVPQYGGYCAYAVSQGYTASIKPELFTIHNGKLYLNYNESVNEKWGADKDSYIKDANINWLKLFADVK